MEMWDTQKADLRKQMRGLLKAVSAEEKTAWDREVLVPGMAFTQDGRRLGKGGGYYDCFLEREPDHETLALAYGFQMVETLPGEEHDRPVDMVITPEQIFFSGRHRGK